MIVSEQMKLLEEEITALETTLSVDLPDNPAALRRALSDHNKMIHDASTIYRAVEFVYNRTLGEITIKLKGEGWNGNELRDAVKYHIADVIQLLGKAEDLNSHISKNISSIITSLSSLKEELKVLPYGEPASNYQDQQRFGSSQ